MTNSRVIRIFLASSISELKAERDKISEYFAGADVQNLFLADNVIIQLVRCEDIYAGSSGERAQEILNQRLRECDISLFLFKTKAGERTREELSVAKAIQAEQKNHTILVYCMNVPPDKRSKPLKRIIKELDEKGPDWDMVESVGDVKAAFMRSILKYERKLLIRLGERYEASAESMRFNTKLEKIEKAGDEHLKKYEFHKMHENKLQEDVHQDIDKLLSQVKEIKDDTSEPVASKIYRTVELYHKADRWASKTDYDKEKYNALLYDYARFLYDCGMYYDAEKVYLRQIALAEELYGKEHTNTAEAYNNIGVVYKNQGDYLKALEYHKKALEIDEKVLGTDHPGTATDYNNIGVAYDEKGDYPEALEYLKKSLELREKVLGTEHPDTAITYNNIGSVYSILRDYSKALEYLKKTLEIKEKVIGTDHPSTATSYNNIGTVYDDKGDYPKALKYYQKALKIREKVLGTDHPSTATSYNNIGSMCYKMENYPEALGYLENALRIFKARLGDDHPATITTQKWIDATKSAMNP